MFCSSSVLLLLLGSLVSVVYGQSVTCNTIAGGLIAPGGCYVVNASFSAVYECSSSGNEVIASGYKSVDCSGSAVVTLTFNSSWITFDCDETDCDVVVVNTYTGDSCDGVPDSQGYFYVGQCLSYTGGVSVEYTCSGDSYTTSIYTSDDCSGDSTDVTVDGGTLTGFCYEYDCASISSSPANKQFIINYINLIFISLIAFIIY